MKKTIIIFILLFIPLFFGLLIGPRAPDSLQATQCYTNVNLIKPFGFSLNCDSTTFLNLAHDPTGLLAVNNIRQSRPGYIILGYLLSCAFKPINDLKGVFSPTTSKDVEVSKLQYALKNWTAPYMAYMLIHFVILLFSTILIVRTTSATNINLAAIFISLFPLFNLLTKSCLFSPHTQLFNIFVPILCYWVALRTWQGDLFGKKLGYITIFLASLGITSYATFILVLPAMVGPAFVLAIGDKRWRYFWQHLILNTFIIILPSLLWIMFVIHKTGSYYHHEYTGGQIAWFIYDNNVISRIINNGYQILISATKQILPYILISMVVLCFATKEKINGLALRSLIAIYISLLFLGLLCMMGFYPERLTFSLIPAWWCVIAYVVSQIKQNKMVNVVIPMIVLFWAAFVVWLDSPTTCI